MQKKTMELRRNLWIKKIILILCFLIVLLWIIINDNSCILGGIKKKITIEKINVKTFDNFHSNYRIFDDIEVDEISLDNKTNVLNIITFKKQIDSSSKYKIFHQQNLMPSKKLPSVLIIGVKKGGTRALLEFLRIHPDIRAAGSEVHFFDRHYNKGLYWYRHRMPPTLDGQITMEKTPSYFITQDAPKRVYHMNSKIKLIIVVRDPVTRSISDYTQVKSKRPNLPKFEIRAFINGTNIVDTNWAPLKIGIYSKYLENWLKYFPLSQLLVVSGERLIADPVIEITRVQDFIGIKRVISEKHFYFNTTKGFPCLMKSEHRAIPHCLGKTKGRSHPHIDPVVVERLRNFYRPFNYRFYQLTGINFGWA